MLMTIFERVDAYGTTWYWTGKDDDTSPFMQAHPTAQIYATELALQCDDFAMLVWEKVQ